MIAELLAMHKRREGLSPAERAAEEQEMVSTTMQFQQLLQSLDPQQRQIMQANMAQMMPSDQLNYMRKTVQGGLDSVLPPSKEEAAEWKGLYLSYFNANLSVKAGRALPLKFCVKNPRPDELMAAF